MRLVAVKDKENADVAFLKIQFLSDEQPPMKDSDFFNSLNPQLTFVQISLDTRSANELIENMQKGIVKLDGRVYEISTEEANHLREDLDIKSLYSSDASHLYSNL